MAADDSGHRLRCSLNPFSDLFLRLWHCPLLHKFSAHPLVHWQPIGMVGTTTSKDCTKLREFGQIFHYVDKRKSGASWVLARWLTLRTRIAMGAREPGTLAAGNKFRSTLTSELNNVEQCHQRFLALASQLEQFTASFPCNRLLEHLVNRCRGEGMHNGWSNSWCFDWRACKGRLIGLIAVCQSFSR